MIKINLLLVKGAKKKETVKQQVVILVAVLATSVAIMAGIFVYLTGRISETKAEISRSENEIQQLKAKIGQIENIKKLQDEVKKKLEILNQLRAAKTGPAKRLYALTEATPEKLWLTKYSESGETVSISGIAYTEELIAEFMRNLDTTHEFFQVELQVSEQVELSGVKAKRFDLVCKLAPQKKEESKSGQPPKK